MIDFSEHYNFRFVSRTTDEEREVQMTVRAESAPAVVGSLACFLASTGFSQTVILRAFKEYLAENEAAAILGAKLLVGEGQ